MIARLWHGMTKSEHSDEYLEFLHKSGIPDYRGTPGNKGVSVLRRTEGKRAHFLLISYWDSYEAIKAFASDEIEKARYYPEDKRWLLEFEPHVIHYDVDVEIKG